MKAVEKRPTPRVDSGFPQRTAVGHTGRTCCLRANTNRAHRTGSAPPSGTTRF